MGEGSQGNDAVEDLDDLDLSMIVGGASPAGDAIAAALRSKQGPGGAPTV